MYTWVCVCVCVCVCTQSCLILLQPHGLQPTRLFCPWDFLGKNTAVGCHFLLQGIFPTQELNLCLLHLLHWRVDSLLLAPLRKPYIYMFTYVYIHTHTHTTHTHTYICISKHILFGRAGIFPYLVDEETEVWQGWLCAQVMFLAGCKAGSYTKISLFQSQLTLPSLFTVEQKY